MVWDRKDVAGCRAARVVADGRQRSRGESPGGQLNIGGVLPSIVEGASGMLELGGSRLEAAGVWVFVSSYKRRGSLEGSHRRRDEASAVFRGRGRVQLVSEGRSDS